MPATLSREQEPAMKQSEPPSTDGVTAPNIFLVGRDSRGHWVVQDERGLCGGLFVDRNKAIRFAMDETGRQPQAIKMMPGVLELDMSRPAGKNPPSSPPQPSSDFHAEPTRRVA
ncbi:MAG TPA: hypothetical protein VGG01_04965 [Xanthobacteraceae bacterium]|jgi:hypothetical protein